jgi:hypothetical protein
VWVALLDPLAVDLNPSAERVAHEWAGAAPSTHVGRSFVPRLVSDALARFAPRTLIGIFTDSYDGFEDVGAVSLADEKEALALAAQIIDLVKRAGDEEGKEFGYSSFEVEAALSFDPPETSVGQAKVERMLHSMYVRDEAPAEEQALDGVIDEGTDWPC